MCIIEIYIYIYIYIDISNHANFMKSWQIKLFYLFITISENKLLNSAFSYFYHSLFDNHERVFSCLYYTIILYIIFSYVIKFICSCVFLEISLRCTVFCSFFKSI